MIESTNKTQLVMDWGFKEQLLGESFYRDIFSAEGYLEIWSPSNPDVIRFYKDGEWSHDYSIPWNLFN